MRGRRREYEPSYVTQVFAVHASGRVQPQVLAAWRAWLRANRSLRYDDDARCTSRNEGNLTEIQRMLEPMKSSPSFLLEVRMDVLGDAWLRPAPHDGQRKDPVADVGIPPAAGHSAR